VLYPVTWLLSFFEFVHFKGYTNRGGVVLCGDCCKGARESARAFVEKSPQRGEMHPTMVITRSGQVQAAVRSAWWWYLWPPVAVRQTNRRRA
jgi:hypothetical protein